MKKKLVIIGLAATAVILLLNGWKVSIPRGARAVQPFDAKRYLGTWYEIARMDYHWERNLTNVTATYSIKEDGKLRVDNKGYNEKWKAWRESIGKAGFVNGEHEGRLKVSFFGPFYAGYNVIDVDEKYQYALVAGNDLNYLWILSRERSIPEEIKNRFLDKASWLGYNTSTLVWTKHDKVV